MSEHGHGHDELRGLQKRALTGALVANALFLGVEIAGGILFNSLALLADAAHMVSDVFALAIALIAQRLLARPATARHSFGLQRAEVLAAQINGLTLLVVSGWIVLEAIGRFGHPENVDGAGVLAVATVGLAVNLGSAVILQRSRGESLNMRGAYIHMALDAVGSLGTIVAGAAIIVWHVDWIDPMMSIFIALLVVWSAWGLLRDTTNVLLEGTPRGLDPDAVRSSINDQSHVASVHHLHLWNLASDVPALSAHVVLDEVDTLHDAQIHGDELKAMLLDRFGITHATLELECHGCDEPAHEAAHATPPPASTTP